MTDPIHAGGADAVGAAGGNGAENRPADGRDGHGGSGHGGAAAWHGAPGWCGAAGQEGTAGWDAGAGAVAGARGWAGAGAAAGARGWAVPGYRPIRALGRGTTGRVVQAVHEPTGTAVAVKYLSDDTWRDPELLARFRAEARTLETFDSPHIAALYEYVETADGVALVMEYVDGVDLGTLLRKHAPLPPEAALAVLKGSLLGLATAHRCGLVHRDYKPGNVLVTGEGSSVLVDFGIAVRQGAEAPAAGTPLYMAPEQWEGRPASPRADVYAATATFFECLTGAPPFPGVTVPELAVQHVSSPVPVSAVREELRAVVLRGMAKAPEERPATAEEFVDEVEAVGLSLAGRDWEERGRRTLAALVSLLHLLPDGESGTSHGTDTATTTLGPPEDAVKAGAPALGRAAASVIRRPFSRKARAAVAAGSAVLALGAVVSLAGPHDGQRHADQAADSTDNHASSSPGSSDTDPDKTPAGTPEESGSPSAGATAAQDDEEAGDGKTPDGVQVTVAPGETPGGTEPVPADPGPATPSTDPSEPGEPGAESAPGPAAVKSVYVTEFQPGHGSVATARFTVATDGPGPVELRVTWYDSNRGSAASDPGSPDGATQTFYLSGESSYVIDAEHAFDGANCTDYRGVLASTSPGAETGRPYRSGWTDACLPR
ncbi:protein kinase [Streptomyces sp. NPDC051776]|uniref:serine/threonine-protein kinase n=1 Tax=Streptomyces sp. NPDC051776 TaxID=3155414 RepID=UPI003417C560